jgi:hypothetical protein
VTYAPFFQEKAHEVQGTQETPQEIGDVGYHRPPSQACRGPTHPHRWLAQVSLLRAAFLLLNRPDISILFLVAFDEGAALDHHVGMFEHLNSG